MIQTSIPQVLPATGLQVGATITSVSSYTTSSTMHQCPLRPFHTGVVRSFGDEGVTVETPDGNRRQIAYTALNRTIQHKDLIALLQEAAHHPLIEASLSRSATDLEVAVTLIEAKAKFATSDTAGLLEGLFALGRAGEFQNYAPPAFILS